MMHGSRKSDDSVVPEKRPNEALGRPETEEAVEERGSTKGNSREQNVPRTRSRNSMPSALERVRRAARRDKKQRFTALLHHIYDPKRARMESIRHVLSSMDYEGRGQPGLRLDPDPHYAIVVSVPGPMTSASQNVC
jgi:hypothetical protein